MQILLSTNARALGSCPEVTQLQVHPSQSQSLPRALASGSDVLLCWDTARSSWHCNYHKTAPQRDLIES